MKISDLQPTIDEFEKQVDELVQEMDNFSKKNLVVDAKNQKKIQSLQKKINDSKTSVETRANAMKNKVTKNLEDHFKKALQAVEPYYSLVQAINGLTIPNDITSCISFCLGVLDILKTMGTAYFQQYKVPIETMTACVEALGKVSAISNKLSTIQLPTLQVVNNNNGSVQVVQPPSISPPNFSVSDVTGGASIPNISIDSSPISSPPETQFPAPETTEAENSPEVEEPKPQAVEEISEKRVEEQKVARQLSFNSIAEIKAYNPGPPEVYTAYICLKSSDGMYHTKKTLTKVRIGLNSYTWLNKDKIDWVFKSEEAFIDCCKTIIDVEDYIGTWVFFNPSLSEDADSDFFNAGLIEPVREKYLESAKNVPVGDVFDLELTWNGEHSLEIIPQDPPVYRYFII